MEDDNWKRDQKLIEKARKECQKLFGKSFIKYQLIAVGTRIHFKMPITLELIEADVQEMRDKAAEKKKAVENVELEKERIRIERNKFENKIIDHGDYIEVVAYDLEGFYDAVYWE